MNLGGDFKLMNCSIYRMNGLSCFPNRIPLRNSALSISTYQDPGTALWIAERNAQPTIPSSGLYGMRLTTPAEPNRQHSFNERVLQAIFDYKEWYNKRGQEVQTTAKTRYLVFN